jgi:hypothetical protein
MITAVASGSLPYCSYISCVGVSLLGPSVNSALAAGIESLLATRLVVEFERRRERERGFLGLRRHYEGSAV